MMGLFENISRTICTILTTGILFRFIFYWNRGQFSARQVTVQDYLYKFSRITEKSEYYIFAKTAEEWLIPASKIDEDFKAYLISQTVPYYVRDFVRKNKEHIDEAHMPVFSNSAAVWQSYMGL